MLRSNFRKVNHAPRGYDHRDELLSAVSTVYSDRPESVRVTSGARRGGAAGATWRGGELQSHLVKLADRVNTISSTNLNFEIGYKKCSKKPFAQRALSEQWSP